MKSFYRYLPKSQRDENWGLYVTNAGETQIPPQTKYPPPGHPKGYAFDWSRGRILHEYALVYISRGAGTFEWGRSSGAKINLGTAFLLFPGVWHRYSPDPETGWHEHWVSFDGDIARRWAQRGFFSRKHPVLQSRDEDSLLALFSSMMGMLRRDRPALQQVLAGITGQLLSLLYSGQQQGPLSADGQVHGAIERAIAHMQAQLDSELNLPALAEEVGVSYSWFRSKFARYTGLSPHQYLLELRLARARNLLTDTDQSVKEIAVVTGFNDEHYFSRIFRRRTSFTPSQWRARSRSPAPPTESSRITNPLSRP